MNIFLRMVVSYLLGSIPFSHIFPQLKGKDVRKSGTGNVGATNALVVAGPLMGALALVGDMGKGFLAVYLAQKYVLDPWAVVFAGFFVILGHDFSVFLKFKGGKGVATSFGTLLALDPVFSVIVFLLWVLLIVVTRYFIPSTLVLFVSMPFMMGVLGMRFEYLVFAVLAAVLAFYTHRFDLGRFFSGKEVSAPEALSRYLKK